jgi:hypothetical protein
LQRRKSKRLCREGKVKIFAEKEKKEVLQRRKKESFCREGKVRGFAEKEK